MGQPRSLPPLPNPRCTGPESAIGNGPRGTSDPTIRGLSSREDSVLTSEGIVSVVVVMIRGFVPLGPGARWLPTIMSFETYPSITIQYTQEPPRYYSTSHHDQFQLNRLHQQLAPAPSLPRLPPPPPDQPSITRRVASKATQKLISSQLRDAGFDSAQPLALQKLELEATARQFLLCNNTSTELTHV